MFSQSPFYRRYLPPYESSNAAAGQKGERDQRNEVVPESATGSPRHQPSEIPNYDATLPHRKSKRRKTAHDGSPAEGIANGYPSRSDSAEAGSVLGVEKAHPEAADAVSQSSGANRAEMLVPTAAGPTDLMDFPQPRQDAPAAEPNYATVPDWLARPTLISPKANMTAAELGLSPALRQYLDEQGHNSLMPVQTTLLPMLLENHAGHYDGDVCVLAPTGSGKTLSYLIPIIESLGVSSRDKLRALIVVPSRELALQVEGVARQCLKGGKARLATLIGGQPFRKEQVALVQSTEHYDPVGYQAEVDKFAQMSHLDALNTIYQMEDELIACEGDFEGMEVPRPDYVRRYQSQCDILIATPGRLVEHVQQTRGFSLDSLEWLVVDEADKLLSQNYQEWIDAVKSGINLKPPEHRRLRKILLSASFTKDLNQLNQLDLSRPRLVATKADAGAGTRSTDNTVDPTPDSTDRVTLSLPAGLSEYGVKAGDGAQKPLYLMQLLRQRIASTDRSSNDTRPSVLIFAKTRQAALRLRQLLQHLDPSLKDSLFTLCASSITKRQKELHRFKEAMESDRLNRHSSRSTGDWCRLMIATDLGSRGLDLPFLGHIVNYDVPPDVQTYVHRVGRTARAGQSGSAWTLITDTEAAWFWRDIAGKVQAEREDSARVRATSQYSICRAEGHQVRRVALDKDGIRSQRGAYSKALAGLSEDLKLK